MGVPGTYIYGKMGAPIPVFPEIYISTIIYLYLLEIWVSLRKYVYPPFITLVTEEWSERVEVAEQRRNGQSLNQ